MVTGTCLGCGRRKILVAIGKAYFVREHKPCGRRQRPARRLHARPIGDAVLTDVWKPREGSAVRVLQDEKYLDHQGAPGVWMVVAPHPTRGSWWLCPYDEASRIWAETHPELAKTMARPGNLLLSAAMALPKDVR